MLIAIKILTNKWTYIGSFILILLTIICTLKINLNVKVQKIKELERQLYVLDSEYKLLEKSFELESLKISNSFNQFDNAIDKIIIKDFEEYEITLIKNIQSNYYYENGELKE